MLARPWCRTRWRRLGKTMGVSGDGNGDGERLTGDASEATGGNCDAPFFDTGEVYWIAGISVLKLDLWGR